MYYEVVSIFIHQGEIFIPAYETCYSALVNIQKSEKVQIYNCKNKNAN